MMTIKPEDIEKITSISEPNISPEGKYVVFSTKKPNVKDDTYDTDIWLINLETKEKIMFTSTGKDYNPVFSKDGKKIAFLSRRGFAKEQKGNALFIINRDGGDAVELLRKEEGIENISFSNDSRRIYFISSVVRKERSDVKVIRRAYFWFNGEGFTYNRRKHLFYLDLEKREVVQVTKGEFDVKDYKISETGRIAFTASTFELKPYITDLFLIGGNKRVKLTDSNMEITSLEWYGDGIVVLGDDFPRGFASHEVLWFVKKGSLKRIDKVDRNKANGLNSDVRAEAHGSHRLRSDSGFIYYLQANGGSVNLYRRKLQGEEEQIIKGERSVEGYDVRGNTLCFVSMDSTNPEELYVFKEKEEKLTSFNEAACKELNFVKPDYLKVRSSDGAEIEYWVMVPNKKGKFPAILYVHGGPKTSFGNSFMFEFQFYVSNGYAVIFSNPRGSDGYTEEFADIRGRYGKRDYQDLMEVLEDALSKYKQLDEERLGVAGGSYGGFMTNWIVGHTDRFRAAVADRSISSWLSMWGVSDIGPYFTTDQISADPWNNWAKLIQDSPLLYAKNVKTPLLMIHSLEDYRCYHVEAVQFFTALKELGKEAELVLFPGENHDLSRNGKPRHRVERLNHYIRWFNKYLT